ncbi:DUF2029 domain-containing protein [Nocardia stercoris]|uniref:DUF2029 domain-containing protein n=1 Tax=Nocardia stercoris TaxID=2483361 RepID=A0A3M2L7Z4_9NOCA|nr:DUF2029 domain-containing protein [Nocardia stercoris]
MLLTFTLVDPWLNGAGILAGGFDLHIYRDGAWKIAHGHPLYTETTFRGLSYTYTPFSTLIFLPILAVPWAAVRDTGLVLNSAVLYGCVLLCWRVLGYRITPRLAGVSGLLALTCVFLEPVRSTLYYGQINLVLMALVLWTFTRTPESDGADRELRGTWIGVAAGIKLVPLFFVAQLLALRQWRTAAGTALTFVGTVVVAGLLLPDDSRQYWTSTFFEAGRIAPDTMPANQSLRGAIAHLTHHAVPAWLWLLVAAPVAVAGLLAGAEWNRRGEPLLAVTLAGMTACAVSPFTWNHHWVWFVPLLVDLVHRAQRAPGWWWVTAALYLAVGAWTYQWNEHWVVVGLFLFPPQWPVAPILLNCYVIVYLVILAAAIIGLRRRRG